MCFQSLVPLVDNVVILVDCVISDNSSSSSSAFAASAKSRYPISSFLRFLFSGLFKSFQSRTQLVTPSPRDSYNAGGLDYGSDKHSVLTHHPLTQLLKFSKEIKRLRIELHGRELGIDNGVLIKWKADFGSTLDNCVIIGASTNNECSSACNVNDNGDDIATENDNWSIPEPFYTNGGLKLCVVASF